MPLKFAIADERHAITEFQATLKFVNPLDPAGLSEVASILDHLAGQLSLPAKLALPTFQFAIGSGAPIAPPPMGGGLGFQRFSPDGKVDGRITADETSISFMSRRYPGWPNIGQTLADFLAAAGAPYFKRSQLVGGVLLQYINEFYSVDAGYNEAAEIFREDSPWVSGIARSSPDLWHSHVGQFMPQNYCKDLVNVNVDVVLASHPAREGDFTQTRLTIVAAKSFDVPGGKPFIILPNEARETVGNLLDQVHKLEKDVLRSTLSDEYLAEVNA